MWFKVIILSFLFLICGVACGNDGYLVAMLGKGDEALNFIDSFVVGYGEKFNLVERGELQNLIDEKNILINNRYDDNMRQVADFSKADFIVLILSPEEKDRNGDSLQAAIFDTKYGFRQTAVGLTGNTSGQNNLAAALKDGFRNFEQPHSKRIFALGKAYSWLTLNKDAFMSGFVEELGVAMNRDNKLIVAERKFLDELVQEKRYGDNYKELLPAVWSIDLAAMPKTDTKGVFIRMRVRNNQNWEVFGRDFELGANCIPAILQSLNEFAEQAEKGGEINETLRSEALKFYLQYQKSKEFEDIRNAFLLDPSSEKYLAEYLVFFNNIFEYNSYSNEKLFEKLEELRNIELWPEVNLTRRDWEQLVECKMFFILKLLGRKLSTGDREKTIKYRNENMNDFLSISNGNLLYSFLNDYFSANRFFDEKSPEQMQEYEFYLRSLLSRIHNSYNTSIMYAKYANYPHPRKHDETTIYGINFFFFYDFFYRLKNPELRRVKLYEFDQLCQSILSEKDYRFWYAYMLCEEYLFGVDPADEASYNLHLARFYEKFDQLGLDDTAQYYFFKACHSHSHFGFNAKHDCSRYFYMGLDKKNYGKWKVTRDLNYANQVSALTGKKRDDFWQEQLATIKAGGEFNIPAYNRLISSFHINSSSPNWEMGLIKKVNPDWSFLSEPLTLQYPCDKYCLINDNLLAFICRVYYQNKSILYVLDLDKWKLRKICELPNMNCETLLAIKERYLLIQGKDLKKVYFYDLNSEKMSEFDNWPEKILTGMIYDDQLYVHTKKMFIKTDLQDKRREVLCYNLNFEQMGTAGAANALNNENKFNRVALFFDENMKRIYFRNDKTALGYYDWESNFIKIKHVNISFYRFSPIDQGNILIDGKGCGCVKAEIDCSKVTRVNLESLNSEDYYVVPQEYGWNSGTPYKRGNYLWGLLDNGLLIKDLSGQGDDRYWFCPESEAVIPLGDGREALIFTGNDFFKIRMKPRLGEPQK